MFKEIFIKLCNEKKESPSSVCRKIGITPATYSCWDDNSVPRKTTLIKIAEYFHVSVEYLLGKENAVSENKNSADYMVFLAYQNADEGTKKAIRKLLDLEEPANQEKISDPKSELQIDVSKAFTKTTT